MSDLLISWSGSELSGDLSLVANDLAAEDGLETAVLLSLYTDRRAEAGDVLPDGETDRRGWWADAIPVTQGDRIGSRLWLLAREKERRQVLVRAEEFTCEALAWLLEDKVASRIDVTASFPRRGVLGLEIVIQRPALDPVRYQYNHAWAAQGA